MNAHASLVIVILEPAEDPQADKLAMALGYPEAAIFTHVDEAVAYLAGSAQPPSYLLVDIGANTGQTLPALDRLAEHCDPSIHVIVIGDVNDVHFYRELKQRGILEYFPRPFSATDIREAFLHAGSHVQVATGTKKGAVISFISAASGDGASTLALNTAWSLANDHKLSTVIVDMDYQFGMIAKNLDLQSPFGIRELFEHPDRGVDGTMLSRMLSAYGDKLKIIAAPSELRTMPSLRADLIRELLHTLQTQFQCVILDIPHVWTGWTSAALMHSSKICMVGQLWLRSVTHSARFLRAWSEIGIDEKRVSLIINRSGSKFKEAVTAQDYERVCNKKVDFYIGNDIKAMMTAENLAKTILETSKSPITKQIRDLANSLVPLYDSTLSVETESSGGGGLLQRIKGKR